MKSCPQRISLNVTRHVHDIIVQRSPVRPFHQTTATYLPRRRTFFTSNPYLAQNGEEPKTPPSSFSESTRTATPTNGSVAEATTKRKPPRTATTRNSLRRVAIIAQQPKTPSSTTAEPAKVPLTATASADYPSTVVSAVCIAEGFHMPTVLNILTSHGFEIDPEKTGFDANEVVHARAVNGGDIFVFPSGTLVTWSLAPDVITRQILRAAEDLHPASLREAEDLDFTADSSRETSVLRGDLVVLGTRCEHLNGDRLDTTLAKIAFSSGLARSTKLAVLETALTTYFESTRHIPPLLAQGRGVPLSRRFILQKTGELLGLRARLNHYSELTDALPDIFWDSRSELGLEGYYEQVGRALDVNVRIRALNQKMDYAQEIATVLREMSSEQHGTRLELIIILLIAVEVIFEVRRIVLEWMHERGIRKEETMVAATTSSVS